MPKVDTQTTDLVFEMQRAHHNISMPAIAASSAFVVGATCAVVKTLKLLAIVGPAEHRQEFDLAFSVHVRSMMSGSYL